MDPLRIFLVDDHAIIREGLKALIDAQPDMTVVGECPDGTNASRRIAETRPDVAIVDVSMPDVDGGKVTAQVNIDSPGVKVLVLTRHSDRAYLRQMLEAGARGYVVKRAGSDVLLEGIRRVAGGEVFLDPSIARTAMTEYVQTGETPISHEELSDRELEVLRLTAWGYSNKEIAIKLNISVKTVETHKTHIMSKMKARSRADLVRYAMRRGWLREN